MGRMIIPLDKPPERARQEPPVASEPPTPEQPSEPKASTPPKPPEPAKEIKRIAEDDSYGIDLNFGIMDRLRGERGTILPLIRQPEDAPILTALQASLHSDPSLSGEIRATKSDLAQHATNMTETIVKKRSGRFFRRLFGADDQ